MNFDNDVWCLVAEGLLAPDDALHNARIERLINLCRGKWLQVMTLADINLVTPALCRTLEDRGLFHKIPSDGARYLSAIREMNSDRCAAIERQLDEAISTLNQAGITPLLLKGAAYIKDDVFPDRADRMMTDLDLWIGREDLLKAQKSLAGTGYQQLLVEFKNYSGHHHMPALYREGDFASVELHEHPVHRLEQSFCAADEFMESATIRETGELRYLLPSPTHMLLLSVLHNELTNRSLKRLRIDLRFLHDVCSISSRYPEQIDWQLVQTRLGQGGQESIFRAFLYVLYRLAGAQPLALRRLEPGGIVRYYGARLVMQCEGLRPWVRAAERLTGYQIRKRFGSEQSFVSMNKNRILAVAEIYRRWRAGRDGGA